MASIDGVDEMGNHRITRRTFFKDCIAWSKVAAMFSLLPGCAVRRSSTLAEKKRLTSFNIQALSLREIAQKKLHHGDDCYLNRLGTGKAQQGVLNHVR